jgi:hypothetical protein
MLHDLLKPVDFSGPSAFTPPPVESLLVLGRNSFIRRTIYFAIGFGYRDPEAVAQVEAVPRQQTKLATNGE